jgi:hypothetical protein
MIKIARYKNTRHWAVWKGEQLLAVEGSGLFDPPPACPEACMVCRGGAAGRSSLGASRCVRHG